MVAERDRGKQYHDNSMTSINDKTKVCQNKFDNFQAPPCTLRAQKL
jgi:hypothetical protein